MACTRRWLHAIRSRPPDDRLSHGRDRDAALDERPRAAARAHDGRKAPLVPGASGPSPLEPRGHRGLLIAVMTEPVTPDAHFGLFFIYPDGYYVSCGEGTIGAATVAIETGMVERQGAETPIVIDTEAGVVE